MKSNALPPKWPDRLIDWLAPAKYADEIKGDLFETFLLDEARDGLRLARMRYVFNTIGFLGKSFFWKKDPHTRTVMTLNYFKMARRNLLANKGTTAINIIGLCTGVAAALVIFCVVRFELSFDTFHSKTYNVYRMVRISGDDLSEFRSGIPYPIADALKQAIPGIVKIASTEFFGGATVDLVGADGQSKRQFPEESGIGAVQPEFFEIFDFKDQPLKWWAGNPATALAEPQGVVLTKSMAKKYFGDEDPLGQTIRFMKRFDFKITGVIDDMPANTDFPFHMMISYASMDYIQGKERLNDWISVNDQHQVFIATDKNTQKADIEAQMAKVHEANVSKDISSNRHYFLQNIEELHFDPRFGNFSGRTVTHQTIIGLETIMLLLLLVGTINYINLSTAQSTTRSKEIGLRKVLGSARRHLVLQFLVETFTIVTISVSLSALFVASLVPAFQSLLGLQVDFSLTDLTTWGALIILIAVLTLGAGLYPAFVAARFNPIQALRSKFVSDRVSGFSLRKVLVVFQFGVTMALAIGTFIVVAQMNFFSSMDMGFDRSAAIISVRVLNNNPGSMRTFRNELQALPYVEGVAASFTLPSGLDRNRSSRDVARLGAQSSKDFVIYEYFSIDEHFLDLYGIPIVAGRNLNEADTTGNILINETLAKRLNYPTSLDAVGAELTFGGQQKVTVVGVTKNFYSNSLKEVVDAVAMDYVPSRFRQVSIMLNLNGRSATDALAGVEQAWLKAYPDFVFEYKFFDDNINAFYEQEIKYAQLFQIFSSIFILIGCLGLYGLITFVVNRKGKEIAVRKTLGASISNIIAMFSREYIGMILISFVIASPIAYVLLNDWLNGFVNHIDLDWWLFAVPGTSVLLIALAVVAAKSYKAAARNPVEKLKSE